MTRERLIELLTNVRQGSEVLVALDEEVSEVREVSHLATGDDGFAKSFGLPKGKPYVVIVPWR